MNNTTGEHRELPEDMLSKEQVSFIQFSLTFYFNNKVLYPFVYIHKWSDHLGGLLSTQEARVALGYRLVRLLRFFRT